MSSPTDLYYNPLGNLGRAFQEEASRNHQTVVATPLFEQQVGGDHYTRMKIQPMEYIHANGLGFFEGSVVKYVTRWKFKNGVEDLKKARDFIDKLIALEEKLDS